MCTIDALSLYFDRNAVLTIFGVALSFERTTICSAYDRAFWAVLYLVNLYLEGCTVLERERER